MRTGDWKQMAYDSVRREVLYDILIEFEVPMKLVSLIRMGLNETYSKAGYQYMFRNALKRSSEFAGNSYTQFC
jgi:Golgi nucleoside diphosphatase